MSLINPLAGNAPYFSIYCLSTPDNCTRQWVAALYPGSLVINSVQSSGRAFRREWITKEPGYEAEWVEYC
jgi:hypothetical protein